MGGGGDSNRTIALAAHFDFRGMYVVACCGSWNRLFPLFSAFARVGTGAAVVPFLARYGTLALLVLFFSSSVRSRLDQRLTPCGVHISDKIN